MLILAYVMFALFCSSALVSITLSMTRGKTGDEIKRGEANSGGCAVIFLILWLVCLVFYYANR